MIEIGANLADLLKGIALRIGVLLYFWIIGRMK